MTRRSALNVVFIAPLLAHIAVCIALLLSAITLKVKVIVFRFMSLLLVSAVAADNGVLAPL